ncbi:MAG: hypothetical protein J1F16_03605 [Muribaculaceae bacterium]|nr:hypothetical protein [Muribaculaceae bacterium]
MRKISYPINPAASETLIFMSLARTRIHFQDSEGVPRAECQVPRDERIFTLRQTKWDKAQVIAIRAAVNLV